MTKFNFTYTGCILIQPCVSYASASSVKFFLLWLSSSVVGYDTIRRYIYIYIYSIGLYVIGERYTSFRSFWYSLFVVDRVNRCQWSLSGRFLPTSYIFEFFLRLNIRLYIIRFLRGIFIVLFSFFFLYVINKCNKLHRYK